MADAESTRAPSVPQQVDAGIFASRETTMADLKAAGWRLDCSTSGNWWFRHRSGKRYMPPEWVLEMVVESEETGKQSVRNMVRGLLGMPVKRAKRGAE